MTTYRETYQPTIMDWEKNIFNGSGIPFREERASLSVFFNGGHHPMFKSRQDEISGSGIQPPILEDFGATSKAVVAVLSTQKPHGLWVLMYWILRSDFVALGLWSATVSNSQQQWFRIMLRYRWQVVVTSINCQVHHPTIPNRWTDR